MFGLHSSMRRALLAVSLTTALLVAVPAARAAGSFDPRVSVGRATDAARAATSLRVTIRQDAGEEQIGPLSLSLPSAFTVATDIPNSNDGQIGTVHVVLWTNSAPVTIDGTLHDDNDRANCGAGSNPPRQCILARLTVAPGSPPVEAKLEIDETASAYAITGDLTSTWADEALASVDGRLQELTATLAAKAGPHTIVRNPEVAGDYPFSWDFTSAAVPSRGLTGGLKPSCHPDTCSTALVASERPPSAPRPLSPPNRAAFIAGTASAFQWTTAADPNGDVVSYTLHVDGVDVTSGTATSHVLTLAPGHHTWSVTASDGRGGSTVSSTWNVAIVDPGGALVFTSATGDELVVDPTLDAFVYRFAGGGAQYGAATTALDPVRGAVTWNERFTVAIAYDATVGSAAGAFSVNNAPRPFVDPPGS